jgi:hypothetical protein
VIPSELKNAPIVLRYGANNKWTYRIATLAQGSIKCETASFNEDPIKVTKECWYVPILHRCTSRENGRKSLTNGMVRSLAANSSFKANMGPRMRPTITG